MARTTKTPGRRSMEFSVEFDQAQMTQLFEDLERNIGTKFLKQIVRGEAAAALLAAAKKTREADPRKIIEKAGLEKYKNVKAYGGRRIKVSDEVLKKRHRALAEKMRRIGSARDAWISIVNKLGLKPMNANQRRGLKKLTKNPPKVNGAEIIHRATGGREIEKGNSVYALEVYYGNPVGRWTGASPALRSAVYGRRAFFRRNLKEGVFKSAKTIAAKYPGVEINQQ